METLNERQREILSVVKEHQIIEFAQLTSITQNTELSMYKDLAMLEEAGFIYRTKEGIIFRGIASEITKGLLSQNERVFLEEKRRIGRFTSTLINNGESLVIDGGSTTLVFASYLKNKNNLMIITNSDRIGNIMARDKQMKNQILLLGGEVFSTSIATYGEYTCETLSKLRATRVIMGTCGISLDGCLFASSAEEAIAKRFMIETAQDVIILSDYSKFSMTTEHVFCDLSKINKIITDNRISQDEIAALEEHDITVHAI